MDGYQKNQRRYGDDGGSLAVAAGQDDVVLRTVKTNHTIFVQFVDVHVNTAAGVTWSIEDTAGISLTGNLSCASAPANYPIDFGPDGQALTAGTSLRLNVSAPGAVGSVAWSAYQKLTSVVGDH